MSGAASYGDAMALRHTVKVRMASLLCSPRFGRSLRWALNDKLPNRGRTFDARDAAVTDEAAAAIVWGFYESSERRFVQKYLPRDRDVIELGSSLGVVTSHIAHRLAPGRKLVCVEANARLLGTLRSNVARNSDGVDARFVNAAVAYDGPTVDFAVCDDLLGSKVAGQGATNLTRVPAVTLSGLRAEHGLDEYSLVMDIEGAEVDIVFGPSDELAGCRLIIAELHNTARAGQTYTYEAIKSRLLEHHGFELLAQHGPVVVLGRS